MYLLYVTKSDFLIDVNLLSKVYVFTFLFFRQGLSGLEFPEFSTAVSLLSAFPSCSASQVSIIIAPHFAVRKFSEVEILLRETY